MENLYTLKFKLIIKLVSLCLKCCYYFQASRDLLPQGSSIFATFYNLFLAGVIVLISLRDLILALKAKLDVISILAYCYRETLSVDGPMMLLSYQSHRLHHYQLTQMRLYFHLTLWCIYRCQSLLSYARQLLCHLYQLLHVSRKPECSEYEVLAPLNAPCTQ